MKLTFNSALISAASQCSAKKDARYYLNGILFSASGNIVATNGHVMFYVEGAFEPEAGFEGALVHIDGKLPTTGDIEIDTEAGVATHRFRGKTKLFVATKVPEGAERFPTYKNVLPKPAETLSEFAGIAPKYLALAGSMFKGHKVLSFGQSDGSNCFQIRTEQTGDNWEKALLLVMPASITNKGKTFEEVLDKRDAA